MRLLIFESFWQIKWIETLSSVEIDIDIPPSDRIDEWFVLVFGVDHDHIYAEHHRPKYLQLDRKGLSSSRFCKYGHICIF